ncbi:hypothetical protein PFISCL1PPCAC_18152, partial [Pristionchus fissidentatus]
MKNQTKAQITAAINSWAATYGVSAQVTAFNAEKANEKAAHRANVTAAVAALPNALTQVYAIVDNQNLTESGEMTQLSALFATFSHDLKNLVGAAIHQGPGSRGGM